MYCWLCAPFAASSVPQKHWTQVHLNTKNQCKEVLNSRARDGNTAGAEQPMLSTSCWTDTKGWAHHWCPRSCPFSLYTNSFLPSSSVVSQLEELRWGKVNHICWGAILHQLHFLRWLSWNWSGSRGLGTSGGQRSGTLEHLCFSTFQILRCFFQAWSNC